MAWRMGESVPLGRLSGIALRANWSVLVIFALVAQLLATDILPRSAAGTSVPMAWLTGVAVAAAFLLTLLAHELAHAVVSIHHGVGVKSITLWMLGGVTELEGEAADARSDLLIAVVGPVVSVVCAVVSGLAAAVLGLVGAPRVVTSGVLWLAVTNLLLAVFNLLPGAPLDGGRVLRAAIWWRTGDRDRGALTATRAGQVTGYLLLWLGGLEMLLTTDVVGGLWLMLIGWFLLSAATSEMQMTTTASALAGLAVRDVMDTDVTTLPAWQPLGIAARRAVDSGSELFPVCDLEGRVLGVVGVDPLVRAAATRPTGGTVAEVMRRLSGGQLVGPDTDLVAALSQGRAAGGLVVVLDGQVVGLVTPARLNQALRRGLLATRRFPDE